MYADIIKNEKLVITTTILAEGWFLINAKLGGYYANKFWGSVIEGIFYQVPVEPDDLENAFKIEMKYKTAGFGLVDSTSFAICEKYKISRAFTFDRKDFSIYKPSFCDHLELLP